jgi:Zn-dependent protease
MNPFILAVPIVVGTAIHFIVIKRTFAKSFSEYDPQESDLKALLRAIIQGGINLFVPGVMTWLPFGAVAHWLENTATFSGAWMAIAAAWTASVLALLSIRSK